MKITVTQDMFRDAFVRMGRKDQFSYEALGAMYDALIELEEDCGTELELDVIAICCEYTEYKSREAAAEDIGCDVEDLDIFCEEDDEFVVVRDY